MNRIVWMFLTGTLFRLTAPWPLSVKHVRGHARRDHWMQPLAWLAFCITLFAAPSLALAQADAVGDPGASLPTVTRAKKLVVLPGTVTIPSSSTFAAVDRGKKAHTNVRYISAASPYLGPPYSGLGYETPASLACIYGLTTAVVGCNPNTVTANPTGGSQTIAIVDAYDDPQAAADLAYFSSQFGLPFSPQQFHVVYQSGSTAPPVDFGGGWELEESLDIEYAHAMAPKATIYLVEANSNYYSDLFASVTIASNLVLCGKTTTCPTTSTGKGEVSMSWGGGEFSGETTYDTYMTGKNVVYFASSGDFNGTSYPCTSPNVVCAGGTSTARSIATGNLIQEIAWSEAGGGISPYEPLPSYQSTLSSILGTHRGVPDLSSDANPSTGVWVYDSYPIDGVYYYDWVIVGGTSVSSPTLTGIINSAGHFAASSAAELTTIYANRAVTADYTDITYGACGYYSAYFSIAGYDVCTGVGSPKGLAGK